LGLPKIPISSIMFSITAWRHDEYKG